MSQTNSLSTLIACAAVSATLTFASPSHAIVFSDFVFTSGAPVSGATTVGGIGVTLNSINTSLGGFPSSGTGPDPTVVTMQFDNANAGTPDSALIFNFDRPITEFAISVDRVKAGEVFLSTLGSADFVTGDLIEVSSGRYSVGSAVGDSGNGTLIWTGLTATAINVGYQCDGVCGPLPARGNALAAQFGVAPIPVPAALPLLATALGGLVFVRRRRGHSAA